MAMTKSIIVCFILMSLLFLILWFHCYMSCRIQFTSRKEKKIDTRELLNGLLVQCSEMGSIIFNGAFIFSLYALTVQSANNGSLT